MSIISEVLGVQTLEIQRIIGLAIHEVTCAGDPDCPVRMEQAQLDERGREWLWEQPHHKLLHQLGMEFIRVQNTMLNALIEQKREQMAKARAKFDKCNWPDCGCLRERKSPRCPESNVEFFVSPKNKEPL